MKKKKFFIIKNFQSLQIFGNIYSVCICFNKLILKLCLKKNIMILKKNLYIKKNFINFFYNFLKSIIYSFTYGWLCELQIKGRGFRLFAKKTIIKFDLGFSHSIFYKIPKNIKIFIFKDKIFLYSQFKNIVKQFGSVLRLLRKFNSYHIKGICYLNEVFKLKIGKKR